MNGKCDIGFCFVTFIRATQRIDIDDANHVYHIKIKEKKIFEQWLEQISAHRKYRRDLFERQPSVPGNENTTNNDTNNSSNTYINS